jgi:hypothetical protein
MVFSEEGKCVFILKIYTEFLKGGRPEDLHDNSLE